MKSSDGRNRVVIAGVRPEIECGRFPIKRVVGESVEVEADIFGDGHDVVRAVLKYRADDQSDWQEVPLEPLVNDQWRGSFVVDRVGRWQYTVEAWIDRFQSWHRDFLKRVAAAQVAYVDLLIGAELIEAAAEGAKGNDRTRLVEWSTQLRDEASLSQVDRIAQDTELAALLERHPVRAFATAYGQQLEVVVDRERANFSAWYEMFPRSCSPKPGQHGTLQDVIDRLPYVAQMGFDVLYLPPIHPIGTTFRKGKNNATKAEADDVGSPWGIGSKEGGHKSIHPELGTFEDFHRLLDAAKACGVEIALDVAFQCSPDHPYVKEHPDWFRNRPDGTIQYAENPPKKYQDIYPIDFESRDWQALWDELKSIFEFWIEHGVRIFRVDNPHTKPFTFWEWCIGSIKQEHPDVLFLAEAFTRPKIMYRLAQLGFSQSYTYFAWRNTKRELEEYVTELTKTGVREFFRPNFWPNTPDILTEHLQFGGRSAFMSRLVLAATLSTNYGIYGPPFEHGWTEPREFGSEEYLHSEKYQIHHHVLQRQDSLQGLITRINQIRREFKALQTSGGVQFHEIDNDEVICYSRTSADGNEVLLIVVNLDPHHRQAGWIELPLDDLELDNARPYQVHDLLSDARYMWHGSRNYVEMDPYTSPAHVFQIRKRIRTERDFEYFL